MRPEALRVVQIIPVLYVGGLERVATALTIALRDRVERVVVCTKGGTSFESDLEAAAVPLHRIPRPRPAPRALAAAALAIAPVLRRERPHVVHAHNPAAGAAAAIARALARLPETAIVTTYHGVTPDRVGRAARALSLASDLVVGVGPHSTRLLEQAGLPRSRTATIFNALDVAVERPREAVRRELGLTHDAALVTTVGRYVEEKNQALLLEALALLAPAHPSLRALLVGTGPLEAELRSRATALGLDDVVRITGPRADAHDVIAASDVFALSSASEGLPLVVLEAQTLGIPVVAADVGGVHDAVRDGQTGVLVPPADATALAAAIERVLGDAGLRTRLAAGGRAFVARSCSPATMTDRYVAAYCDAFALRARARARRTGASPSK